MRLYSESRRIQLESSTAFVRWGLIRLPNVAATGKKLVPGVRGGGAIITSFLLLATFCIRGQSRLTCVYSGGQVARSSASPHPSVIIGNKSSVKVGPGVFVGQGKGAVALDDPNAPNKTRCAILDGVSYCY